MRVNCAVVTAAATAAAIVQLCSTGVRCGCVCLLLFSTSYNIETVSSVVTEAFILTPA